MKDGSGKDTFYEYYSPSEQNGGFLPLLKNINRGDIAHISNQTAWEPDSRISYSYFPHNLKRKSMEVFKNETSVQKLDYDYDVANRLTNIFAIHNSSFTINNYSYAYKPNWDLVSSVTAPEKNGIAVSQTFSYDGLGRRLGVTTLNPNLGTRTYHYNAAGQRSKQYLPDNFSIHYNYDKLGQLISAQKYKSLKPYSAYSFNYLYDKIGNRIDEKRNGFDFDFLYNNLNQMTNRSWTGTLTASGKSSPNSGKNTVDINAKSGILDANGKYVVQSINVCEGDNFLITAVNKDSPLPNETEAVNSLTTKSIKWEEMEFEPNKINLKYDSCGNLTNDGVRSYTYNAENRLIECSTSVSLVNYKYDGLGRKVLEQESKDGAIFQENSFIYDGWSCVLELKTENLTLKTKSYIWGLDLSGTLQGAGGVGGLLSVNSPFSKGGGGGFYFYCYDGNGNVINLVNIDTKEIAAHYEYDPFGRLIEKEGSYADENFYRFSTKRVSKVFGIYDYGYRWYDPDYKFWLTRDPIGEKGGLNLYGFVGNNPVNYFDKLGLIKIKRILDCKKARDAGKWAALEAVTDLGAAQDALPSDGIIENLPIIGDLISIAKSSAKALNFKRRANVAGKKACKVKALCIIKAKRKWFKKKYPKCKKIPKFQCPNKTCENLYADAFLEILAFGSGTGKYKKQNKKNNKKCSK